jgi:acid stress-induced BolA-like protein IbaG/YrbA
MEEPLTEIIQSAILAALPCQSLQVSGDGQHFEAVVVSAAFEGKSRLARHQLVLDSLKERLKEEIHALSIKTFTPQQWQEMQN